MGTPDRTTQLAALLASVGAVPYTDKRADVLQAIRDKPGITFDEIRKVAVVGDRKARNIVRTLENEGLIVSGQRKANRYGWEMVFVATEKN